MWRQASRNLCVQQYRTHRYTFITVVSLSVILLAFFISFSVFAGPPPAPRTLKLIHVVFRHGDRTPTYSYANDPHKSYVWFEGKGALTAKGKLQLFEVGEILKSRYGDFLGDLYLPDEVEMQSSYAPRCQMSAQTFLAGLYPPKDVQVWNPSLLWQPIPVNPIPRALDNKIAARAKCHAFELEKKKSDLDLLNQLPKEDKEVFEYLEKYTGESIKDLVPVDSLYYTLKIQKEHDLAIPNWTEAVFPAQLEKLTHMNLASYTRTDLLKRLQAGPMLKEWIANMKQHRNNPRRKGHFYSGHDLTIVSLLNTLGVNSTEMPEYGATLIIEYHQIEGFEEEGTVEVYQLKNRQPGQFQRIKLPFCDLKCPLTIFSSALSKYIPADWEAECKNS